MKPWIVRSLGVVLLVPALVTLPARADAATPIWFLTESTASKVIIQGTSGNSVSASCGSNVAVAGWVTQSAGDDLRRQRESLSSAGYSVVLDDETPAGGVNTVTAHVRCVPASYFSGAELPAYADFGADPSTHLAQGTVFCPTGYKALSARVLPQSTAAAVLTSEPTTNLAGWEFRSWQTSGTTRLEVECRPAADFAGMKTYVHLDSVGWGAGANADCPSGMVPITGGTVQVGGDSQALSINIHPTATGWASTTENLDTGGLMQTTVACMPSSNPTMTLTGPAGLTSSTAATWSFTAVDPATAGGYTMSTNCRRLDNGVVGSWAPCSSPFSVTGLGEGFHQIDVQALTSDGRSSIASRSVTVDTTAPLATYTTPAGKTFDTASPVINWAVSDANTVPTVTCALDGAALATCPVGPGGDFRRPLAVNLSGVADGSHTFHVHPSDAAGNGATYDLAFTVDTVAPSVTFADPPDTVFGTSARDFALTVADGTSPVPTLQCALDAAALAACPVPAAADQRGARSVGLSGLPDGPHTLHVRPTDAAGNAATYDLSFSVDTVAPTVTVAAPRQPFVLATSVRVAWAGTDAGSGITGWSLSRRSATPSTGFGAWSAPSAFPGATTSTTYGALPQGSTQCFSVTATDAAANASTPATTCVAVPLDDRKLARAGTWRLERPSSWFQGTAVSTKTRGAQLSTTATTQRLALVAQKCPTCGVVGVYVGSTLIRRIDLHAATSRRQLVLLPTFPQRTGTVKVRVLSTGKTVRIDALGMSRG